MQSPSSPEQLPKPTMIRPAPAYHLGAVYVEHLLAQVAALDTDRPSPDAPAARLLSTWTTSPEHVVPQALLAARLYDCPARSMLVPNLLSLSHLLRYEVETSFLLLESSADRAKKTPERVIAGI